jgi:hypothetical protein
MFMCAVNQKSVNKLDLTWKQSFLIEDIKDFSAIDQLTRANYAQIV